MRPLHEGKLVPCCRHRGLIACRKYGFLGLVLTSINFSFVQSFNPMASISARKLFCVALSEYKGIFSKKDKAASSTPHSVWEQFGGLVAVDAKV